MESKLAGPRSLPRSSASISASSNCSSTSVAIKASSFYSTTRHVSLPVSTSTVSSSSSIIAGKVHPTAENQHLSQPSNDKNYRPFQQTPGTDHKQHQGSLHSPFTNRQSSLNHVLEARAPSSEVGTVSEPQPQKRQELSNDIDHWVGAIHETVPTNILQNYQHIKMVSNDDNIFVWFFLITVGFFYLFFRYCLASSFY